MGGYGTQVAETSDPLALFRQWLNEARKSEGPWSDALNLATTSAAGRPSVRAVMLRGFDDAGLVFFSDEGSRKGRELAENPWAAASFTWPQRKRQVRMEGPVTRLGDDEAEGTFADRPADRRVPLWAWRQDTPIADRAELQSRLAETKRDLAGAAIGRPPYWVGFRLNPDVVEFWEERPEGLHERLRYRKMGPAWSMQRLAP
jgi:pyridoxamine 5'-phosphate oxidase